MKIYKTSVNDDIKTYLQRLYYDCTMRERIIEHLISSGDQTVLDGAAFKRYQNELSELNAEYMMAQSKLENEMLPVGFTNQYQASWNLDFNTNVFTVKIMDDKGIKKLEECGYELLEE